MLATTDQVQKNTEYRDKDADAEEREAGRELHSSTKAAQPCDRSHVQDTGSVPPRSCIPLPPPQ